MEQSLDILNSYISDFCTDIRDEYTISPEYYKNHDVHKGLRNSDGTGVLVGVTDIGSVQGYHLEDGSKVPIPGDLYYRGISVIDIVNSHYRKGTFGFEEVAYLLLMGKLPSAEQFEHFNEIIAQARPLPEGFSEDMILKVSGSNVMNILSRCVMALYTCDPAPEDNSIENLLRQSIELIARFPAIVSTAYAVKRHHFENKSLYIHNPKTGLSTSENFLRMLRKDKSYSEDEAKLLDLMLILHAEHGGGNNSTFTCRCMSSTGTDTYSAIAGAVGSLKGPLHGGANAKVMEMFDDIRAGVGNLQDEDELDTYLHKILHGEVYDHAGKIYGLGHAVYTVSDPRAVMIKKYARSVAESKGCLADFELIERVERLGIAAITEEKHLSTPICANVDLYSGFVYSMLGIPRELYTPLFALARIAGWCAHRIEEVMSCNRIMRPAYRATVRRLPYIEMENR